MKQKLKKIIIHRLSYVTKLMKDKRYDPVKDGFFKPVFKAFFLCKVS